MSTAIDALVARAQDALAEYASFTQEQIDHIVRKASVAALHHHGELAVLAVEETGRGLFEDKAVKNMFACEHVTHSIIKQRTVGVISHDEITGITEIADPVGVVAGITPCAPTSRSSPPAAHPPRAGGTSRSSAPCRSGRRRSPAATPSSSSPAP